MNPIQESRIHSSAVAARGVQPHHPGWSVRYVELKRTWKTGDSLELSLPKSLRLEALADNPHRAAIMWGPLVLAGDLGPEQRRSGSRDRGASTNQTAIPVFLAAERPVTEWVRPVAGKAGEFRTEGVGRDKDVELVPFYRLHHRNYGVYWSLFTPDEWQKQSNAYAADQEKKRKLEAATVSYAQPGEMQPEREFNFQGEESSPVRLMDKPARRGAKWFSFDLPVDASRPMTLTVTYNTDEPTTRSFEILVEGKRVGQQTIDRRSPEQVSRFFDVEYPIPADLVKGKQKATVRFQAVDGNEIGAVFGLRMIRGDAER